MLCVPASAVIDGGYVYNQSMVYVTESTTEMNTASGQTQCSGSVTFYHGVQGGTWGEPFSAGNTPTSAINPWANTSISTYNHIIAASYCYNGQWGWGNNEFKRWTILNGKAYTVNVTFTVTSTDYTTKINNALVTVGYVSGNTDANGTVLLGLPAASSGYTYTVTATGYAPITTTSLGAYGLNGGTVYVQMQPTSTTPMYFSVRDESSNIQLSTINLGIREH